MMPPFERVELRTERLLLRPVRSGDEPDLFAMFSDPAVMRYWSSTAWTGIEQAHEYIARDSKVLAAGESLCLGIERMEDSRLIGTCTLFRISEQCRRAEVGYALGSDAWGRGYMHEALLALLEYGFSELGLNRIEADIDPRNQGSARSVERLGFKKEGHLRERWIVNGEVSDSAMYGLLRSEWQSRK